MIMKISVLSAILTLISLLPTYAQQNATDSVTVTFHLTTPESVTENKVFWAGSLNSWDPGDEGDGFSAKDYSKALTLKEGYWTLRITAPENQEASYKYTRGSIYSVEEKADFTYLEPRTVTFDKNKTVYDTVAAWHDRPPESLAEQWPKVPLKKVEKTVTYKGKVMDGFGTLLYDKAMGARYFDVQNFHTGTTGISAEMPTHVDYFLKVSDAPDNTIYVMAGKLSESEPWNLYLDQNNDNSIDSEEIIFTIDSDTVRYSWSGDILIQKMIEGEPVTDTVNIKINHAPDVPPGYRSSATPGAPDLTYQLPFKQRVGTLNGNRFFLNTQPELTFWEYYWLVVDRDRNGSLEIGSGSNEAVEVDKAQMHATQTYYIHPKIKLGEHAWEVVDIDRNGDWIRFRPSLVEVDRKPMKVGKPGPTWSAETLEGNPISSESFKGSYVLLDFWGSWCGPCIEEIPLLKRAYRRFQSENFEMVGFAYESRSSLQRLLDKIDLPWPQVLDDTGSYSSKFLVSGYPTHYLIGPDGTLLEKGYSLRGEKLIDTLEKYLGK